jgi:hypothetical protein
MLIGEKNVSDKQNTLYARHIGVCLAVSAITQKAVNATELLRNAFKLHT